MKKIRNTLIMLLIMSSISETYSQSTTAYRLPSGEKAIPKLVLSTFKEMYPDILLQGWYITHLTYWQNDYSSGWYTDWYGQRTLVVYQYEKPMYFEVEFINRPGELSRAIYNVYGYWYETRSQVKGLPLTIIEILKESEYNGWKISGLKERIESPAWSLDIYRFKVSKGLKSRIIRMDEKGNIIQAKYLED